MPQVTDLPTRTAAAREIDIDRLSRIEELVAKAYQLSLTVTDNTYDGPTYRDSKKINAKLADVAVLARSLRIDARRWATEAAPRFD